ncbi:hypothetical phage protein [Sodalis glossinidius str. 'morsitans']|uniref:Hypothetical phage protein n=1 Tax=Sodalis glossinidius (strain morsitans) TaxID=343509 RepID=Q2NTM7_SODGM|nr:hypothetical protein [Sodalis glossinidius]BAE74498.1 hypothetical phage protein [Sodalis glossinidius str. 'morsitans']
MSIETLVLGKSGSSKSTSLRNLDPEKLLLIQCISKPLPFRSSDWKLCTNAQDGGNRIRTDNSTKIEQILKKSPHEIVVIDDYQSVLVNELMNRSSERGYDKFTDIGKNAWSIFNTAGALDEHRRVYILAHTQTDDFGNIRMKTVGKMVDQTIVPEGYFTIVLRAVVNNGNYRFSTQTNGQDCCKSSMGIFSETLVDNDLKAIDDAICSYYGINNIQMIKEKTA